MSFYKLTFNVYADKIANIKKDYVLIGDENPVFKALDGVKISEHRNDIFFWQDFVSIIDKDDIDKAIRIVVVEDKQAYTNIIKGAFLYQNKTDSSFRIEFEYAPVIINRQRREDIYEKEGQVRKLISRYCTKVYDDNEPYDRIVSSRNIALLEEMFEEIQSIFHTGINCKDMAYYAYDRSLIEIFGLDEDVFWTLDSDPAGSAKKAPYMDKDLFMFIIRTSGFAFAPLCEAFTHRYRLIEEDRQKKILARCMRSMREHISTDTIRFKNEEACAEACPDLFEMFINRAVNPDSSGDGTS